MSENLIGEPRTEADHEYNAGVIARAMEAHKQRRINQDTPNGSSAYKATVLAEAIQLITRDRNIAYGDANVNMVNAAQMVTSFLAQRLKKGNGVSAHDMAMIMVISKISRIACGEFKRDNYVDAAGYLAIAAEIGFAEQQQQEKTNAPESTELAAHPAYNPAPTR